MFKQIVADHKIYHRAIVTFARIVANQCVGLPLVIKTVASYFKLKNKVDEWRNDLEKLKEKFKS